MTKKGNDDNSRSTVSAKRQRTGIKKEHVANIPPGSIASTERAGPIGWGEPILLDKQSRTNESEDKRASTESGRGGKGLALDLAEGLGISLLVYGVTGWCAQHVLLTLAAGVGYLLGLSKKYEYDAHTGR